jgi:hypothetical protein
MNEKTLVIIAHYDRRPVQNLWELIASMFNHPAGGEFDIRIVVNRTKNETLVLPEKYSHVAVEYRHNVGMNIGAWDHGWRMHQGYRDYLFLQDECYVIRDYWLSAYRKIIDRPEGGIVGESLSKLWDRPWGDLRLFFRDKSLPEHSIDGRPVNRVDFYLRFLQENGVDPGTRGTHLRSVIWFLPGKVLERINGFLIGRNYGECIAAEIAASKKVEQIGLRVEQANHDEEFFYIRHLEYNQDHPGQPYSHDVKYVDYASIRRLLESRESELWQLLRLKFRKLVTDRVRRSS